MDSDIQTENFKIPDSTDGNDFTKTSNTEAKLHVEPSGEVFYNWLAATAGEGTEEVARKREFNTTNSICPKEWDLPTKTDYENMYGYHHYVEQPPLNFVRLGQYEGNLNIGGDIKVYTSTACGRVSYFSFDQAGPYVYSFWGSGVNAGNTHDLGLVMRCVFSRL